MSEIENTSRNGLLARFMRNRPAKPGEIYGVPGSGDSLLISLVTGVILIGLWTAATSLGWIKPLFLPSPITIFSKAVKIANEGFANNTLWEHIWISALRVFGALALACATAIPIGLAMATNLNARFITI